MDNAITLVASGFGRRGRAARLVTGGAVASVCILASTFVDAPPERGAGAVVGSVSHGVQLVVYTAPPAAFSQGVPATADGGLLALPVYGGHAVDMVQAFRAADEPSGDPALGRSLEDGAASTAAIDPNWQPLADTLVPLLLPIIAPIVVFGFILLAGVFVVVLHVRDQILALFGIDPYGAAVAYSAMVEADADVVPTSTDSRLGEPADLANAAAVPPDAAPTVEKAPVDSAEPEVAPESSAVVLDAEVDVVAAEAVTETAETDQGSTTEEEAGDSKSDLTDESEGVESVDPAPSQREPAEPAETRETSPEVKGAEAGQPSTDTESVSEKPSGSDAGES